MKVSACIGRVDLKVPENIRKKVQDVSACIGRVDLKIALLPAVAAGFGLCLYWQSGFKDRGVWCEPEENGVSACIGRVDLKLRRGR